MMLVSASWSIFLAMLVLTTLMHAYETPSRSFRGSVRAPEDRVARPLEQAILSHLERRGKSEEGPSDASRGIDTTEHTEQTTAQNEETKDESTRAPETAKGAQATQGQSKDEIESTRKAIHELSVERLPPLLREIHGQRHNRKQQNPFVNIASDDNQIQKVTIPHQTRFVGSNERKAAVASMRPSDHCVMVHIPGKGMVCSVQRGLRDEASVREKLRKTIKLVKEHRGKEALGIHAFHPKYDGDAVLNRATWLESDMIKEHLKKGLKVPDEDVHQAFRAGTTVPVPNHTWNRMGDPESGHIHEVRILTDQKSLQQRFHEKDQVEGTFRQARPKTERALQQQRLDARVEELRKARESKATEAKKTPPYKQPAQQGKKD